MCDFTLAVPEAKFGYTEVRIGFVPAIVSSMLVWQVGHKIARDLLLTGRLIDAAEAHAFGLVNEVVEPARSDGSGARTGVAAHGEQSVVGASDEAPDQRIHRRTARPSDRAKRWKTTRASAPLPTFAKASRRFWKNANRAGAPSERTGSEYAKQPSAAWSRRAGCGCATRRPIRWAWSTTPITSSGSKSVAST